MNEWGTADVGEGKACKSVRRLAVLVAGTLGDDGRGKFTPFSPDELTKADIYLIKVPVMSVKGYAQYVRALSETIKRPPHGVFSKLYLVPDTKSQFRVMVEALGKVEASHLPAIMGRREEAIKMLEAPHLAFEAQQSQAKPSHGVVKRPLNAKLGPVPQADASDDVPF